MRRSSAPRAASSSISISSAARASNRAPERAYWGTISVTLPVRCSSARQTASAPSAMPAGTWTTMSSGCAAGVCATARAVSRVSGMLTQWTSGTPKTATVSMWCTTPMMLDPRARAMRRRSRARRAATPSSWSSGETNITMPTNVIRWRSPMWLTRSDPSAASHSTRSPYRTRRRRAVSPRVRGAVGRVRDGAGRARAVLQRPRPRFRR